MPFTELEIKQIVDKQRKFFHSGATLDVKWRIAQLRRLRDAVTAHEEEFEDALHKDLGRSRTEAYLCDVGPIIVEINEMRPVRRHRSLRNGGRTTENGASGS